MPCKNVMIKNVITGTPDMTVGDAMTLFDERNIRSIPIVDSAGALVGVFNMRMLLINLLPLPIVDEEDPTMHRLHTLNVRLDHIANISPWVARNLANLRRRKISEVMVSDPASVDPETPLREAIRLIVKYGSPLPVVRSDEDKTLVGVVSMQSVLRDLIRIGNEGDAGHAVHE